MTAWPNSPSGCSRRTRSRKSWRGWRAADSRLVCNCTVCRRYGALWIYGFDGHGVRVLGPTKPYIRGKALSFNFCVSCGCVTRWLGLRVEEDGRRRIAVNARLSEPESVAAIPIDHFDGFDTFEDLPGSGRCVKDYWS